MTKSAFLIHASILKFLETLKLLIINETLSNNKPSTFNVKMFSNLQKHSSWGTA